MQAISSSLDVQGVCAAAACAQSSEEDVSDTSASDTSAVRDLHILELPEPSSAAAGSQQGEGSCRSSTQCSSRAASVQSANTSDLAVAGQGQPGHQQQTVLHASSAGLPASSPTHETQAAGHGPVPQQGQQQEQQGSDDPQQQSTDQPCQLQQLLARYSLLRHTVSRLEPSNKCEQQPVMPTHHPAATLGHRAHQHSPQLPPLPAPRHQHRQQPQALQPGHQQAPVAQSGCQPAQLPCSGPSSHTDRQQGSPSTQQQQQHPWLQDLPHGQQQPGHDQQQQQPAKPDTLQTRQGQLLLQQQLLQRMPADPPDPGRPAAQEQGKKKQVPAQQQQLYSVPLSSRPWGWWRAVGGCVLPGLDGVRLPLLQLHGALGSAHSSAALLQAMGRPGSHQQHSPASSVGPALLECWQHLLAVEQVRQQVASTALQQQQHEQQQQQQQWSPPPPHQQQQKQQQKHAPEVSSTSSGQGTSPPACHLASEASAGAAAAEASSVPVASSKAPAAPKLPKRPWQPRMQPDEPNWDKAAFSDIQSRCSQPVQLVKACGARQWPRTLAEHSTASFAQLMLLHQAGWPNHVMWEHWQAAHTPGSMAMFVHMKAGVSLSPGMPGRDSIARCKLKASVDARWGDISLVEAQLASMDEILKRCPQVTHIGLASGHDVPVQLIRPGLLLPGVSLFGMYQFGPTEMRTLKVAVVEELVENSSMTEEEAQAWGRALTFHHQWMVMSREHAAALVHHTREIMMVGRLLHKACCSVRAGMAPDEFIIITALKQLGYVRSVQRVEVKPGMRYPPGCLLNSYPTFVVFPAETSPHPVLWTHPDKKVKCQVEKNTGQQYFTMLSLNDCLDLAVERCAIFFRKVEIRQTRGEELVLLLSSLEAMWQGRRKGSSASIKSSSSSGSSKKRGKRKSSPPASNSNTPDNTQDTEARPAPPAAAAQGVSLSQAGQKKARLSGEVAS